MNKPNLDIQKVLFQILHFEGIYFKTWFPPNRSSEFYYLFIDIKMCLRVKGNYGMNFRPNPKLDRTKTIFLGVRKWKMETLVFSLPLKKNKTIFDFLLIIEKSESKSVGIPYKIMTKFIHKINT